VIAHCLDCGAERQSDQCPSCGLTSEAAEVMLRHRLLRRTAVLLVGGLLFVPASQVFPPLDLDLILIFVGLVFFTALWLVFWIDRRARKGLYVEALKRIFFGLVPLPWVFAILLFVNGKFDGTKPVDEPARVISKLNMGGPWLHTRRLIVRSWRDARTLERVPVDNYNYDRFRQGDNVVLQVQPGLLGIPWVYGVYRQD
jgi:hypothetical protein